MCYKWLIHYKHVLLSTSIETIIMYINLVIHRMGEKNIAKDQIFGAEFCYLAYSGLDNTYGVQLRYINTNSYMNNIIKKHIIFMYKICNI